MTNTYRILSVVGKATYGDEELVELDLSADDEKDNIDNGHLELVPRTYQVLSDNFSGGPQGSTYDAVFRVETEQALIQGGHIKRIDTDPAPADPPPADEPPPAGEPSTDTPPAPRKRN